jgi:hypothetical protein
MSQLSPILEPADTKMCVAILHACPLALQLDSAYVPLVWREPGFDEMKNAMNSSLEASELTRNMPIAIEMKHACNASFNAVFGQKVAADVLILSGQELELLDQQQQQPDTAFSIIVEDDVGAAASLYCPRLMKMKPEEFPKVIIVHGNFPTSSPASSPSSSTALAQSPAAFLFTAGALGIVNHHHHHHATSTTTTSITITSSSQTFSAGAPCVISVCSAPPSLLEGEHGGGSDKDRALFFTRRVACSIVAQVRNSAAS